MRRPSEVDPVVSACSTVKSQLSLGIEQNQSMRTDMLERLSLKVASASRFRQKGLTGDERVALQGMASSGASDLQTSTKVLLDEDTRMSQQRG
jgi:hypothetical protein